LAGSSAKFKPELAVGVGLGNW